jgi:hypothetical protein
MTLSLVSSPSVMALSTMSAMMKRSVRGSSTILRSQSNSLTPFNPIAANLGASAASMPPEYGKDESRRE